MLFCENGKLTSDLVNVVRKETIDLVDQFSDKKVEVKKILNDLYGIDETLQNHITGVCIISTILGNEFLSKESLVNLAESALYHDIGKLKIPRELLNKPGKLTPEEFQVVKSHVIYGVDELTSLIYEGVKIPKEAPSVALNHHERFNGTGYPSNKKGDYKIGYGGLNLFSRIVAIADIYSALLMRRSYKDPIPPEKALEIMKKDNFDPEIFNVFEKICRR
jgi:HD-GYP domain-containing protein (c-di-GMP phosphodiesterase class II)